MNSKEINYLKYPYRGIFAEIAREKGVTPQAVRQGVVEFQSPKYLDLFNKKVTERLNAKRRFNKFAI